MPLRVVVLAISLGALAGCATKERALVAGNDECEQCRMTVSDTRFGGEIITTQGRLRTFDSAECLAAYVVAIGDSLPHPRIFVSDYESSMMVPAASARFLRGGRLHSPMGRELAAFAGSRNADSLLKTYGGELLTWAQVLGDAAATQEASPYGGSGFLGSPAAKRSR